MNYNHPTTMYESIFTQMYVSLAEKYDFKTKFSWYVTLPAPSDVTTVWILISLSYIVVRKLCSIVRVQDNIFVQNLHSVPLGCKTSGDSTPYTPLLYSKIGIYRCIHNFLTFALKHRLWVLVRTFSTCTHNLCFEQKTTTKIS